MAYDVKLIGAKLRRWENYLKEFRLPQWNELPDMDLYMDQVVMLLQRYLNFLPETSTATPPSPPASSTTMCG